jgi:hypothetical protein
VLFAQGLTDLGEGLLALYAVGALPVELKTAPADRAIKININDAIGWFAQNLHGSLLALVVCLLRMRSLPVRFSLLTSAFSMDATSAPEVGAGAAKQIC